MAVWTVDLSAYFYWNDFKSAGILLGFTIRTTGNFFPLAVRLSVVFSHEHWHWHEPQSVFGSMRRFVAHRGRLCPYTQTWSD